MILVKETLILMTIVYELKYCFNYDAFLIKEYYDDERYEAVSYQKT